MKKTTEGALFMTKTTSTTGLYYTLLPIRKVINSDVLNKEHVIR